MQSTHPTTTLLASSKYPVYCCLHETYSLCCQFVHTIAGLHGTLHLRRGS